MEKIQLKDLNKKMTRIGLGTNAVGGHNLFENINEADGKEYVREAIKLGVNFIDTADVNGFGRSEELVGEVLKEFNREELIIATKGAQNFYDLDNFKTDNRPQYLREAFEKSLSRLKLDYVDIYYLHFPDGETPFSESIGELAQLKAEGKINSIGISNISIEQLKEANVNGDISFIQAHYNMLDRSSEKDLIPYALEHNIAFIPYGPLAFGLLGGGFSKDSQLAQGDWRQSVELFNENNYAKNLAKVENLKAIAKTLNITLPNLALAWLMNQEGVTAVIPGGRRKERIQANILAADIQMDTSQLEAIEVILNS